MPGRLPIGADRRGVSEVVGFILLFGLLMVGLTIIQVYAVPAQNEKLEFEHSLRAQADMGELAEAVGRASATGASGSETVDIGLQYPSRLFLLNPSPASGTLRTNLTGTVSIANAIADGETGDYWNGSTKTFDTTAIRYDPDYTYYWEAPATVFHHGVVYNDFGNTVLVENQGSIVRGTRLSLVTIEGDFHRAASESLLLDVVPLSATQRTVSLRNDTGPITIELTTGMSVAKWQEILADEMVSVGGHVVSVSPGSTPGTVAIELAGGVTYDLRMAHLRVGPGQGQRPGPHYIQPAGPSAASLPEAGTTSFVVEVRDRFNNPVSGVTVRAQQSLDAGLTPLAGVSDADGQVRFTYDAPLEVDNVASLVDTINLSIDPAASLGAGFDPRTVQNMSFDVAIQNIDGSGIRESDVGLGGESDWGDGDRNKTFSVAHGRWDNIPDIDGIVLSNGQLVTSQVCVSGTPGGGPGGGADPFYDCVYTDKLQLSFTLSNGGSTYVFDVALEDTNQDGSFDEERSFGGPQDDSITIEDQRQVLIEDGAGNLVFEGTLSNADVQSLVFGSGEIDLLDAGIYESTTGSLPTLDSSPYTWLTNVMYGRVDVALDTS